MTEVLPGNTCAKNYGTFVQSKRAPILQRIFMNIIGLRCTDEIAIQLGRVDQREHEVFLWLSNWHRVCSQTHHAMERKSRITCLIQRAIRLRGGTEPGTLRLPATRSQPPISGTTRVAGFECHREAPVINLTGIEREG